MLSSDIRNKIDKIWTDIWGGGITNPITVVEQMTYLMFIRSLDEKELESESLDQLTGETSPKIFPQTPEGQEMRWCNFKHKEAREIYEVISTKVFPFIKTLGQNGDNQEQTAFSRYMKDAMFAFPEGKKQLLEKVVTELDKLYEEDITDQDMLGDLYEYMLGKLATAGQNGQFRTPKHIRDMMVQLMSPTPDDWICDPACGTAGFLVSSTEYIRREYEATMISEQWEHFGSTAFSGFDSDETMLRLSAMNLMLHSIGNPHIEYRDSVSKQNEISSKYSLILANPPFAGTVDKDSIHDNLKAVTDTNRTELLFLALFLRMLKVGGRCACIVPDGVLSGSNKAFVSIRKELVENHLLQGVISMPSGVFKPYAGVSTAILIFSKTGIGGTENVWFYEMKADGLSLDDKRKEIEDNDIPDIIARFHNLEGETENPRTAQSFFVPKEEIAENKYDLSLNRYKEFVYEKVEYEKPTVILEKLECISKEIALKEAELRGLLP
ncbi:MAG: class I SAM-dependent DNA methyltransferase [Eubacteriales bacterium]